MENKKFENIEKDAELLFQEELNEIVGGNNSDQAAALCGNCCILLAGGAA